MIQRFHRDGDLPSNGEIFVFGSNLAGRHGAAAAAVARMKFGAQSGWGVGFAGQSYAIPTKDWTLATLPVERIGEYVVRFLDFARRHLDIDFFVTRIGCGLAGYRDEQIASLFRDAPWNCSFAEDWRAYLDGGLVRRSGEREAG